MAPTPSFRVNLAPPSPTPINPPPTLSGSRLSAQPEGCRQKWRCVRGRRRRRHGRGGNPNPNPNPNPDPDPIPNPNPNPNPSLSPNFNPKPNPNPNPNPNPSPSPSPNVRAPCVDPRRPSRRLVVVTALWHLRRLDGITAWLGSGSGLGLGLGLGSGYSLTPHLL